MPVTLTIKHVPDAVAAALRDRARANRRSLQQELLLLAEQAAGRSTPSRVAEPAPAGYPAPKRRSKHLATAQSAGPNLPRLSLGELWERARRLGTEMPAESTAIVRRDRDAGRSR